MAKYKTAKKAKISPWLSANKDCAEGRFIQVGNSLALSKKFQSLGPNAKWLYLCMALESGGKPEVKLSKGTAEKKYGINSNTFDRAKKELIAERFIDLEVSEEMPQFKTNVYKFINGWKAEPAPHFGVGEK